MVDTRGHAARNGGLLPDSYTRPSITKPKRVTRKDREAGRTKKQCRQHNRRIKRQDLPRANIHANASRVLSRPSGYRVPETGPGIFSRARGVSDGSFGGGHEGEFSRESFSFFLYLTAWEMDAIIITWRFRSPRGDKKYVTVI